MRNDLSALDTALDLLERGRWPVVLYPLGMEIRTKDGIKIAKGKEPIGKAWGVTRPTEAHLHQMFRRFPEAGVGLLLGPGGGVVDFEQDGAEGEESLLTLFGGELVETMGWSSRRGPHRLHSWDDRLALLGKTKLTLPELPGLEIRLGGEGDQLQSAVPPTLGEDGSPRRWNSCETIAKLPDRVIAYLVNALARPETVVGSEGATGTQAEHCGPAKDSAGSWFRRAMENEAGRVATAREGARHDALRDAALTVGGYLYHGYLDETQVIAELTHAGRRAGLPDEEVRETITWGLSEGKAKPLPWPDRLERPSNVDGARQPRPIEDDGGDDDTPVDVRSWPAPPDEAVYHGLAGRIIKAIEPHTESDPLGLLIQLLVMFGNVVGRSPFIQVENTRHHANEFTVLVGRSSMARKGTSADWVRKLFQHFAQEWVDGRIKGGLSSGEGLITAVRDPISTKQPIKDKGRVVEYQDVLVDEGVTDKRLLALESEFGGVLRALEREGNKLSALVRQCWDHGNLSTLTKSPLMATNAHISIIGHITAEELLPLLSRIDAANGFANRFLWFAVHRTKILPFGGEPIDLTGLAGELAAAVESARTVGRMGMSRAARALWEQHYERLTTPPPGVLGQVTSRGAPHSLRLALQYALMEGIAAIEDDHLHSALALWDASARCAVYIFGDSLNDPVAEKILNALRSAAPAGLTRSEIREKVLQKNTPSPRIKQALALLMRNQLIREERDEATGGRPAYRYYAINAVNAKSPAADARSLLGPRPGMPMSLPYDVNGVNGVPAWCEIDDREVFEL